MNWVDLVLLLREGLREVVLLSEIMLRDNLKLIFGLIFPVVLSFTFNLFASILISLLSLGLNYVFFLGYTDTVFSWGINPPMRYEYMHSLRIGYERIKYLWFTILSFMGYILTFLGVALRYFSLKAYIFYALTYIVLGQDLPITDLLRFLSCEAGIHQSSFLSPFGYFSLFMSTLFFYTFALPSYTYALTCFESWFTQGLALWNTIELESLVSRKCYQYALNSRRQMDEVYGSPIQIGSVPTGAVKPPFKVISPKSRPPYPPIYCRNTPPPKARISTDKLEEGAFLRPGYCLKFSIKPAYGFYLRNNLELSGIKIGSHVPTLNTIFPVLYHRGSSKTLGQAFKVASIPKSRFSLVRAKDYTNYWTISNYFPKGFSSILEEVRRNAKIPIEKVLRSYTSIYDPWDEVRSLKGEEHVLLRRLKLQLGIGNYCDYLIFLLKVLDITQENYGITMDTQSTPCSIIYDPIKGKIVGEYLG